MASAVVVVDFFDVGQADCSVVQLSDGSLVIIDVGTQSSTIIDFLQDHQNPIAAVVLTHNHFDHAGAMPAVVHEFKNRIGMVFMLLDADPRDEKFLKIFRPVAEAHKAGFFDVVTLDSGRLIASDPTFDVRIGAVYPTFVAGVSARTKNDHSGVVCLTIKGKTEIIWPGDLGLRELHAHCDKLEPTVLVGPHHGGPDGAKHKEAPMWVGGIAPRRAFISVGSNNQPKHPKPIYLRTLVNAQCKVICSQITRHCDPQAVARGRPILPSHGLLGLPAPRNKGVSCRGAFRLVYDGTTLQPDRWDREHRRRVDELRRPLCLP